MDIALLLIRLALAVLLFAHGTQKWFGWFNGPGLAAAEKVFAAFGQRPAAPLVRLAILCEITAAALLALGLAFPLACAIAARTMTVAAAARCYTARAFADAKGGGEYPAGIGLVALLLVPTGGGRLSLDTALGAFWVDPELRTGLSILAVALLVVAVAALPPVLRTRSAAAGVHAEANPTPPAGTAGPATWSSR